MSDYFARVWLSSVSVPHGIATVECEELAIAGVRFRARAQVQGDDGLGDWLATDYGELAKNIEAGSGEIVRKGQEEKESQGQSMAERSGADESGHWYWCSVDPDSH